MINNDESGRYIKFYIHCMMTGKMPDFGLCNSLGGALLELFKPTEEDEKALRRQGLSALYWASGLSGHETDDCDRWHSFTPLRQTIVLFMACINNEL